MAKPSLFVNTFHPAARDLRSEHTINAFLLYNLLDAFYQYLSVIGIVNDGKWLG